MSGNPLSDERLADAFVAGRPDGARTPACLPDERFWDAARGALATGEVEHLLDHAAECAACGLALRIAREVHAASGLAQHQHLSAQVERRQGGRLWRLLAGTVLRPEPALAYLLLLALSWPLYRNILSHPEVTAAPEAAVQPAAGTDRPQDGRAAVPSPEARPAFRATRVLTLETEPVPRGGGATVPPLRVSAAAGEVLVLRIFLDLDAGEIESDMHLRVHLASPDRMIMDATLPPGSVDDDGSLTLVVDRLALQSGVVHRLEVARNGDILFRRSLVPADREPR